MSTYQKTTNVYGCPLRDQTGADAIKNFETIVAQLPPDQRARSETERADLQHDYHAYLAEHGYRT